MNAQHSKRKTKDEGKRDSNQNKSINEEYRHREKHQEVGCPRTKQKQVPYRTHLQYIAGRKLRQTITRRQNKTKTNTYLLYKSTSLVLAPQVELAKVRSSPGVIECFRFPLDPPVPRTHVLCRNHPIPSILDNISGCDPLPSFAFATDRLEGLEVFLEAAPPRCRRSTSSLWSLHRQPPKHDSL